MVDDMKPFKKRHNHYLRVIVKFEDLKCKPKETLKDLCSELGIQWSDKLMNTTSHGDTVFYDGISGFDLRPVYDSYERYFTEFDRMRLIILLYEWQFTYGYPYVDVLEFSRKDLQEMFIRDFLFEGQFEFMDRIELWKYRMQKMDWVRSHIQRLLYMRLETVNDI